MWIKTHRSDRAYAQTDLRLCWSHIPHCWKSHVEAHLIGCSGSEASYFVFTYTTGSGKTGHSCSLACSIADHLRHKYPFHLGLACFISLVNGLESDFSPTLMALRLLHRNVNSMIDSNHDIKASNQDTKSHSVTLPYVARAFLSKT